MTRVGVVGAGVMGTGLTQNLTEHGHEVVLVDRSKEALDRAHSEIVRYERFGGLLGATGPRRAGMTERVTYSTDLAALAGGVPGGEHHRELGAQARALSPAGRGLPAGHGVRREHLGDPDHQGAARTGRPDRVLGMHFMNPVPMKSTVEVIRGWHTSQQTIDTAMALLAGSARTASWSTTRRASSPTVS